MTIKRQVRRSANDFKRRIGESFRHRIHVFDHDFSRVPAMRGKRQEIRIAAGLNKAKNTFSACGRTQQQVAIAGKSGAAP